MYTKVAERSSRENDLHGEVDKAQLNEARRRGDAHFYRLRGLGDSIGGTRLIRTSPRVGQDLSVESPQERGDQEENCFIERSRNGK
jgi:hypothetical protein